jgi:hypothetical protein
VRGEPAEVTPEGKFMRGFLPLLNGLLDAANLLKYVQGFYILI